MLPVLILSLSFLWGCQDQKDAQAGSTGPEAAAPSDKPAGPPPGKPAGPPPGSTNHDGPGDRPKPGDEDEEESPLPRLSVPDTIKKMREGGAADDARKAAILRCAGCHPKQHADWLKGPHAFSRNAVLRSLDLAMDEDSYLAPGERREYIDEVHFLGSCGSCHSPNATVFDKGLPKKDDAKKLCPHMALRLELEDPVLTSGVDCITCHVQGDHVLATPDFRAPKDPPDGWCNPVPSSAFSRIGMCGACHVSPELWWEKMEEGGGKVLPYVHCNQCHARRDEHDRPTHHYYFASDPEKLEKLVKPIFDGFEFNVERREGKPVLHVKWTNDFAPHSLLEGSPRLYLVDLRVFDASGKEVEHHDIRFHAVEEDGISIRHTRHNPGAEFSDLKVDATFERSYKLPSDLSQTGRVQLRVRHKRKFDYPDSESHYVLEREHEFSL